MHAGAFDFVRRVVQALPPLRAVVEFGSRAVNGSVREIFTDAAVYVGIDRVPGAGVDVVADAADWHPAAPAVDAVVCCEVLEHAPDGAALCASAFRALRPGGCLVVTCAAAPREPHSADADGPPKAGEHYRNVAPDDLAGWCRAAGFSAALVEHPAAPGDLYCLALKAR